MPFERSRVEIDLDNFAHNISQLKKFLPPQTGFMQIVKADAYGHGAYEIAAKSIKLGACFLGVANLEEGILLRYQAINTPILILSPCFADEIENIIEYGLIPAVSSYQFAERLDKLANGKKIKVHIDIDTGMGRTGIHYKEALTEIQAIRKLNNLEIEGIFSHYSSSESDIEFTDLQNRRFYDIIDSLDFPVKYIHIANSAGVITDNRRLKNTRHSGRKANLVRLGLLSYGIYPNESYYKLINLKPVMSFKSNICRIKTAHKGDSVGYNRTFIAERETKYGIIPVGYADGYDYLLSNKGYVKIAEKLCPVIGKVSMDMISVDITDTPDIKTGDEVTLVNGGDLKAEKITGLYNGLPYELMSQIGRRAKRYYRENGKIIATAPLARRDFVSHDFTDKKLNLIIESAISQRLQSKEIANMLYSEVLRRFFSDKDRNIHYRKNFRHSVVFKLPQADEKEDFFEVETTLSFTKVLQQNYFYVACANQMEDLEHYFRRRDVEYRWLLDSNFSLSLDYFRVAGVTINNLVLNLSADIVTVNNGHNSLEIKCSHPQLEELVGEEVDFSISTKTYYPRKSVQLPIYITELTKGIEINFHYPDIIEDVEVVTIFSGQTKYSLIHKKKNQVQAISARDEWVFPNSGIVFSYKSS